ncbi:MAG: hypothetical protein ABEJ72_05930, partial [Candidatus Aenigmatarchaeota archaeon]
MDFARVLLVGIVIFSVLLIFFGGQFTGFDTEDRSPGYRFGPVEPPENDTKVVEEDKLTGNFFVGRENETDYRYFTLSEEPFKVSFEDRLFSLGEINRTRIKRGFLADSTRKISFNLTKEQLNRLRSLKVNYFVEDTNLFGRFVIELNSEKVFSEYVKPGTRHSLKINTSLLKKTNEMRIYAESSGARFWAPTVYVIENFTVDARILGRDKQNFIFSLNGK